MARPTTWRERSLRVIAATLAALPDGASLRDRRTALYHAYPFGPREHHPYKVWCKAVREALGLERRERGSAADDPPPHEPCFALERAGGYASLRVDCGWCAGRVAGGCMVCLPWHREVRALLAWGQWPAWKGALAAGDPVAPLTLADRLDDLGLDLLPAFFRGLKET